MSEPRKPVRWYAREIGRGQWHLDARGMPNLISSAHCICCAYADAITRYGGDCDLRGLSPESHGRTAVVPCYAALRALVRNERATANRATEAQR